MTSNISDSKSNSNDCTVIVLDDDKDILDYCRLVLENAGYHVITDCSGKRINELVEMHSPVAIIVDLYMPEMDGMETIFSLHSHYKGCLIAMSSNRDMLSLTDTITHAQLEKPLNSKVLIAAIKSAG
jgi:DNA-binding response OmpR family regulator